MKVTITAETNDRDVTVTIEDKVDRLDVGYAIEVQSVEDISTPLQRQQLIEKDRRAGSADLLHDASMAALTALHGRGER